jgi:hypothetical protein
LRVIIAANFIKQADEQEFVLLEHGFAEKSNAQIAVESVGWIESSARAEFFPPGFACWFFFHGVSGWQLRLWDDVRGGCRFDAEKFLRVGGRRKLAIVPMDHGGRVGKNASVGRGHLDRGVAAAGLEGQSPCEPGTPGVPD